MVGEESTPKPQEFLPVLGTNREATMAIMQENLGGEQITANQLLRIVMPSGKSKAFEISELEGPKHLTSIEAIIIYQHQHRAWWEKSMEDGGVTAPDCSSPDAVNGVINAEYVGEDTEIGGDCDVCPKAKFGSASDGRRQACKLMRRIFLMREGAIIPCYLDLPPTSLINYRNFMTALTNKALPYYGVIVRIGLEQDKSKGNVDYNKATFSLVRVLSNVEVAAMSGFRDKIVPYLKSVRVEYDQK